MLSCAVPGTINIIQGQDKTATLWFTTDCGRPFDLTGAVVTVKFPTETTPLALVATIVSAIAGKTTVTFTDIQTATLAVGEEQDFEAFIVIGSNTFIVQFSKLLNVKQQLFT